jgi:putative membrane protein
MSVVAQVFAALAAFVHVLVFVWETLLIRRPAIHRGIFRIASEDVPAVLLWSVNQGFYNLFLAGGTIAGLVALHTGDVATGRVLVLYTCAFMALCGVVLGVSDAFGLGRPKGSGWTGALGQLSPPLVVLIATAVA